MSQRTRSAKAAEEERRRSSTRISPSTPREPIQVEYLEYEQQKWIADMEGEGTYVFDLLDFDFIVVGTKMVGEKIRDTPMSEPLGED